MNIRVEQVLAILVAQVAPETAAKVHEAMDLPRNALVEDQFDIAELVATATKSAMKEHCVTVEGYEVAVMLKRSSEAKVPRRAPTLICLQGVEWTLVG